MTTDLVGQWISSFQWKSLTCPDDCKGVRFEALELPYMKATPCEHFDDQMPLPYKISHSSEWIKAELIEP